MSDAVDARVGFESLVNLASARIGAVALAASDDFFAPKERLVRDREPVWRAHAYTDRGKWMDGWESRRRRTPGHDWCVVRLGLPGIVRGVVVDTRFFRGNFPERCWLEACDAPEGASPEQLAGDTFEWIELVTRSRLTGDALHRFAVETPWRFTHVRLHIHPDGGVARLRVHGEPLPGPGALREAGGRVDLAALAHGGAVAAASDEFFGSRHHLILRGRSRGMADGWETRRRRGPGHDWVVVRLAGEGTVTRALLDTSHFKGNAPGAVALDAADDLAALEAGAADGAPWRPLLRVTPVHADRVHRFERRLLDAGPARVVRLRLHPDGGVARLRLYGTLTVRGREELGMRWLDALPPAAARDALGACTGGAAWAERLVAARPFGALEALLAAASRAADGLSREDWLACFASHPRIGESRRAGEAGARERAFSAAEQAAAGDAGADQARLLAVGQRRYEQRFGHGFLIAAAGRGAREILAELERRLALDAEAEFANAVAEQRTIAARRLRRLVTGTEERA